MNSYSFPMLRYGNVCKTSHSLNLENAENVAEFLLNRFDDDSFCAQFKEYLELNKYSFLGDFECIEPASRQMWEGWVTTTPIFNFRVNSEERSYEITCSASVVACMEPNRSKIWVTQLLKKTDGVVARNLDPIEVVSFLEFIEIFSKSVAAFLKDLYEAALSEVIGVTELLPAGEIFVEIVGNSELAFTGLANEMRQGKILSISQELENQDKLNVLSDFLQFIFKKEIKTAAEYDEIIMKKKCEWQVEQETILKHSDEIIEQGGLGWFGLKYENAIALFSREESFLNPMDMRFFGMAALGDATQDIDVENMSKKASKAIVETVSPYI